MNRRHQLLHEFVEFLPDSVEEGKIYISIPYATVAHKCCCGCGNEVVTPLTPTDWKLIFDGEAISLHPSIGNWEFKCQSHYWIKNNRVEWAGSWSKEQIEGGRIHDRMRKQIQYGAAPDQVAREQQLPVKKLTFWQKVGKFLS